MITIKEYNNFMELEGIKSAWESLQTETGKEEPFYSMDWAKIWWKSLGENHEPVILVAYDEENIIGIIPLMVTEKYITARKARVLSFISSVNLRLACMLISGRNQEVIKAAIEYLAKSKWDLLDLNGFSADSENYDIFCQGASQAGWKLIEDVPNEGAYIELIGDFSQYLANAGKNLRKDTAKKERRLEKEGKVELQIFGDSDCNIETAINELMVLSKNTWKEKEKTGLASSEKSKRFYTEILREFYKRKKIEVGLLKLDGKSIASGISLKGKESLYLLKIDYDENRAYYSPGNILNLKMIEKAFNDNFKSFEFLTHYGFHRRFTDRIRQYEHKWVSKGGMYWDELLFVQFHVLPFIKNKFKNLRGRFHRVMP